LRGIKQNRAWSAQSFDKWVELKVRKKRKRREKTVAVNRPAHRE
jgi:hypothetical protein